MLDKRDRSSVRGGAVSAHLPERAHEGVEAERRERAAHESEREAQRAEQSDRRSVARVAQTPAHKIQLASWLLKANLLNDLCDQI